MRALQILSGTVLLLASSPVFAQSLEGAYNLSDLSVQGTARSVGFGGALGSVGGDFSAISVNPAGLGVYRTSELAITPTLRLNGASSSYLGNSTSDNTAQFGISHFGLVITNAAKGRRYEHRNWKAVSMAFGMNRVADFNHTYNYSGINRTSSATQAMESSANRDTTSATDPTTGTLGSIGVASNLINNNNGQYQTVVPFKGGINQLNSVEEKGSINEFVFALGGNYKEKLLLGVSLGIPSVNYERNSSYTENVLPGNQNNPENFTRFTYENNSRVTGGGVNLKLGAIYKISDHFRVGAALHTPTWYSLTESSDFSIASDVSGNRTYLSTYNGDFPSNQFDYKFRSPTKFVLSATYILKNLGFITADYEYVNYATMHYTYPAGYDGGSNTTFQQEATAMNDSIKNNFGAASNFRVGAEIKLSRYFMVRGGFGYYGSPYLSNSDYQRIEVSGGLGFRAKHFFADLGFRNSTYSFTQQPYNRIDYNYVSSGSAVGIPSSTTNYSLNNIVFTVGAKF